MLETRLAARRLLLRQFRNFSARSLKELGETEPVGHLREIEVQREFLALIVVGNIRAVSNPGAMTFTDETLRDVADTPPIRPLPIHDADPVLVVIP